MNNFTQYTASAAKNNFGQLLVAAYRAPVAIMKRGRPAAYVVAPEDMELFEDFYLARTAQDILDQGTDRFMSTADSEKFLDSIRNA